LELIDMEPEQLLQLGASHERDRLRVLLQTRREMLRTAIPRPAVSRISEIDRILTMLDPAD
jgi:hypothetical protein